MSRATRPAPLRPAPGVRPAASAEAAGCPDCGGVRQFTTDVITGRLVESCPTCERLAEQRRAREAFERAALAAVARRFELTPDEVERRLRRKAPSQGPRPRAPRTYTPKPCARCAATFTPTGPRTLYCPSCRGIAS
jgi:hypothetical protein